MHSATIEQFVLDQIPLKHQRLIAPTLRKAYDAADTLGRDTPLLRVASARDNHGRLISWAVDHFLQGLIESGQWPVDFRWQSFDQPTGRYLEVRLSHSTMSVSQVADWKSQPRNVSFRANARLSNQPYLQLPEFAEENQITGPPAFLLVHGHKTLNFAHIGVPNRFHELGYLYQTQNLLGLLHAAGEPEVPAPESKVNVADLMSLKEEIERWQHDHEGA